jgi:hypothetical protein
VGILVVVELMVGGQGMTMAVEAKWRLLTRRGELVGEPDLIGSVAFLVYEGSEVLSLLASLWHWGMSEEEEKWHLRPLKALSEIIAGR